MMSLFRVKWHSANQQVFRKYAIFSLLTKCLCGPYFGGPGCHATIAKILFPSGSMLLFFAQSLGTAIKQEARANDNQSLDTSEERLAVEGGFGAKYELLKRLGNGAFGFVQLAKRKSDEKKASGVTRFGWHLDKPRVRLVCGLVHFVVSCCRALTFAT